MGLIICPGCGHEVSDKLNQCEHCGTELLKKEFGTCEDCGTIFESSLSVCPNCGCPLPQAEGPEDTGEAAENNGNLPVKADSGEMPSPKKGKLKKKLISVCIAATAVIAAVVVIIIITGNSVEGVARQFVKAWVECDYGKMDSLNWMPIKDGYQIASGFNILRNSVLVVPIPELYEDMSTFLKEAMLLEYGEYTYEIRELKVDKYWTDKLKDAIEDAIHEGNSGIDYNDISGFGLAHGEIRIHGEKKSETLKLSISLLKYKGQWGVFEYSSDESVNTFIF